jgi:hypothetical protein
MGEKVKVRCTRPMMLGGETIEAGAELALSPFAAADAIASGRAVYVVPTDAERTSATVVEQRDRTLRALTNAGEQGTAEWMLRRQA